MHGASPNINAFNTVTIIYMLRQSSIGFIQCTTTEMVYYFLCSLFYIRNRNVVCLPIQMNLNKGSSLGWIRQDSSPGILYHTLYMRELNMEAVL